MLRFLPTSLGDSRLWSEPTSIILYFHLPENDVKASCQFRIFRPLKLFVSYVNYGKHPTPSILKGCFCIVSSTCISWSIVNNMFIYFHVPLAPIRRTQINSHQSVIFQEISHLLRYFHSLDFLYREKIHAKIIHITSWWFQIFCIFTPNLGEMIQFDVCIFFKWVGSTTN